MSTLFLLSTIAVSTNYWGGNDASYWNYSADTNSGEAGEGNLRLNGQNAFSNLAKFEVVTAKLGGD